MIADSIADLSGCHETFKSLAYTIGDSYAQIRGSLVAMYVSKAATVSEIKRRAGFTAGNADLFAIRAREAYHGLTSIKSTPSYAIIEKEIRAALIKKVPAEIIRGAIKSIRQVVPAYDPEGVLMSYDFLLLIEAIRTAAKLVDSTSFVCKDLIDPIYFTEPPRGDSGDQSRQDTSKGKDQSGKSDRTRVDLKTWSNRFTTVFVGKAEPGYVDVNS